MVCNYLSVVTATLDARDADELYRSEVGLAAYAQALAPLIGAFMIVRAPDRVSIQGERATIRVTPDGIQIYAGYQMGRAEGEALAAQAVEVARQLALPLAQQRLVDTIKATYGQLSVVGDAYQGAARVTRVRIPV